MPFFVPSDSLSIFYTTHGSASNPTILLIHGWCCDSHDWSWQIPFLSRSYYVIAYDLRGHGDSSAPLNLAYAVQDHVADATGLLQHLGIRSNVLLMGHSMGGVIASAFCFMHRDMVKGLVMVDPPCWNPPEVCDAIARTFATSNATDSALQSFKHFNARDTPDWIITFHERRVEGIPEHVIRKCIAGCYEKGMLLRPEVHTEFIKGKRNVPRFAAYANEDHAEKEEKLGMKEGVDEVHIMAGLGHWMHQAKPEEFNEMLRSWLEKI